MLSEEQRRRWEELEAPPQNVSEDEAPVPGLGVGGAGREEPLSGGSLTGAWTVGDGGRGDGTGRRAGHGTPDGSVSSVLSAPAHAKVLGGLGERGAGAGGVDGRLMLQASGGGTLVGAGVGGRGEAGGVDGGVTVWTLARWSRWVVRGCVEVLVAGFLLVSPLLSPRVLLARAHALNIHACMCLRMCLGIVTHACVCTCVFIYIYKPYPFARARARTHTHTHTHRNEYAHTHECIAYMSRRRRWSSCDTSSPMIPSTSPLHIPSTREAPPMYARPGAILWHCSTLQSWRGATRWQMPAEPRASG